MGELRRRPLVIAHRGACKYAPENTLSALTKAIALGVDGVEIDVQLTRDKVPVVLHENALHAVTTTYRFVHQTPLRALQTIDVGAPFGTQPTRERIPTLAEALETLRPSPLLLNIEIKAQPHWHFGIEDRVVRSVRDGGMSPRTIFSSFSPMVLMRLRYLAPQIPRALLIGPGAFSFFQAQFFGRVMNVSNIHCCERRLTPKLLAMAAANGWQRWVWTINTRAEAERVLALGIDGIITDDPLLIREVIGTAAHGI
ncbi:MAG: hypothetical protein HYV02_04245 [Deltaproteobacteria bacterium]|nr:hypothetical protein [Deltaproteobacteria bacterium]